LGTVASKAWDWRRTLVVWRILRALHEAKTFGKRSCNLRSAVLGLENPGDSRDTTHDGVLGGHRHFTDRPHDP
jgi:hypothetical protein